MISDMLFCAFYYPWYVMNWLGRTQRRLDPPLLGQYDNTHYGEPVLEHMRMMRKAGIDFVLISWDPRSGSYDHVLDAAEDEDMKACVFYESLSRSVGKHQLIEKECQKAVLLDMERLAEDIWEDCWMRVEGKPVVMLYVSRNYLNPNEIFPAMREVLGDVYLVGDEMFWGKPLDSERIKHFDCVTSYNWYQPGRFEGETEKEVCDSFLANIRECVEENLKICKEVGVPYWPVAMPGYDDRRVRPQAKHDPIPRMDGYFFKRTLEDAMALDPECIAVCSLNETFEDTQIEPHKSYGDKYLEILCDFTPKPTDRSERRKSSSGTSTATNLST